MRTAKQVDTVDEAEGATSSLEVFLFVIDEVSRVTPEETLSSFKSFLIFSNKPRHVFCLYGHKA